VELASTPSKRLDILSGGDELRPYAKESMLSPRGVKLAYTPTMQTSLRVEVNSALTRDSIIIIMACRIGSSGIIFLLLYPTTDVFLQLKE
jgi:hypothetical protein